MTIQQLRFDSIAIFDLLNMFNGSDHDARTNINQKMQKPGDLWFNVPGTLQHLLKRRRGSIHTYK